MKHLAAALALAGTLAACAHPGPVAHSGGTDAAGCHDDGALRHCHGYGYDKDAYTSSGERANAYIVAAVAGGIALGLAAVIIIVKATGSKPLSEADAAAEEKARRATLARELTQLCMDQLHVTTVTPGVEACILNSAL